MKIPNNASKDAIRQVWLFFCNIPKDDGKGFSPCVWAWILLFHRPCHPEGLLRGLRLPYLSNSNRGMELRSRRRQPFLLGTATLDWGCSYPRRILATSDSSCSSLKGSRDGLASLGAFHFSPHIPGNQKLSLHQLELVSTDKCTKTGWFSCANRSAEVDCWGIAAAWQKCQQRPGAPYFCSVTSVINCHPHGHKSHSSNSSKRLEKQRARAGGGETQLHPWAFPDVPSSDFIY